MFQQTLTGAPLIERRELADRVRAAIERGSIGLVAGAGYGKTVLVEQALEGRTAAWMSCRFRDLEVDRLLVDALQAIRRAVPGAADVLLESVGGSGAPLPPIALTRAMLDELEALLVEPLVFVLDDAEQLADSRPVLDLLEQLVETEQDRLRIVICTRTPLELRVARAQATGRVSIINESELAFSAEETGKSMLARLIHAWSPRSAKPFATVSCPSLSAELLESELFGHVRGAFTGALRDNPGRIAVTDGGTLFLDEIGDLPLAVQPKLLRFLQERAYERVGESALFGLRFLPFGFDARPPACLGVRIIDQHQL